MMKGGFGMNPGNMQNLMRQAQKLQADMAAKAEKAEEELENATITASSGGGMVTITMNGKRQLQSIRIKPEVVDADDVEMLEDLVLSCVNDAILQADKLEEKLKPNLPNGLF